MANLDVNILWFGEKVFNQYKAEIVKATTKGALILQRDVVKSFGGGASRAGVKIRRSGKGKRRKFHRPSAPGSVPNVDFGALRASIGHEIVVTDTEVDGFVGVKSTLIQEANKRRKKKGLKSLKLGTKYGLWLELGTSRMAPRPFLRPALIRTRTEINNIFQKAVK